MIKEQFTDAVLAFVRGEGGKWTGTVSGLLVALRPYVKAEGADPDIKPWPTSARLLSGLLGKQRKALAAVGIEFTSSRSKSADRRATVHLTQVAVPQPQLADADSDDYDYMDDRNLDAAALKRVKFYRSERKRLAAKRAAEEEARSKIRGCITYNRANPHPYRHW